VGKTQVAKRLVEQDAFVFDGQHNSTHAIVMLRRKLADFQLNCWDFAGQDLYHDTHRIFMQTKALFVLVWDTENEKNDFHTWHNKQYENEKLEYWLKYAKYFGNGSPIMVLQNKIDVYAEDLYFEQKKQLKEKYPIVDFLEISAKTNQGFEVFEEKLAHIFATYPTFQTPDLPKNWVKIREEIIKLQETETKTIGFSEFERICYDNDTLQSAHTILQYLHDTGVLYYHQRYFEEKIIINQSWAIEAIYKVLDRESTEFEVIQQQKGILFYQNMCNIWRNNTETERWLFINFMLSAGLAMDITSHKKNGIYKEENRTFAIPQLLPKEKPAQIITWEQENTNNLHEKVLFYHFLPKQTIYNFIRYAIALTKQNIIWRQGVWLKIDHDFIFVEVFYEEEKSKIIIKSSKTTLIEKIMKVSDIRHYAQTD
jgi:GTPase SAR1 family protein